MKITAGFPAAMKGYFQKQQHYYQRNNTNFPQRNKTSCKKIIKACRIVLCRRQ